MRTYLIYKGFSKKQKKCIYEKYLNYKLHSIMTGYNYCSFKEWILSYEDLPNIFIYMAGCK